MNIIDAFRQQLLMRKAEIIFHKLVIDFEDLKSILEQDPNYDGVSNGFYQTKGSKVNKELVTILNEMAKSMDARVTAGGIMDSTTREKYILYQLTNKPVEDKVIDFEMARKRIK